MELEISKWLLEHVAAAFFCVEQWKLCIGKLCGCEYSIDRIGITETNQTICMRLM